MARSIDRATAGAYRSRSADTSVQFGVTARWDRVRGGKSMRKVSLWLAPVVAAAAIMALTLGGVAQASKHVSSSPVKGAAANVRPNNAGTGKLLKNNVSVQNQSGNGSALVGGFNNVDSPHTIVCPATKAPCTIETI